MSNKKVRAQVHKNPHKVVELGPIKIYLRGYGRIQHRYVSAPLEGLKHTNDPIICNALSEEYLKRMLKTTIVKVENLETEDQNGEVKDFEVLFTDEKKLEMTEECYDLLFQVLDQSVDTLNSIDDFYKEANKITFKEVEILDKKKDINQA